MSNALHTLGIRTKTKESDPYRGLESSDSKGHSNSVGCKVAPYHKEIIDQIMKYGDERGWKTESDFIRFCLRLGMDYVKAENREGEKPFMTTHGLNLRIDAIVRNKATTIEFLRTYENLASAVSQCSAQGLKDEAYKLIYDTFKAIEALPEGETRDHYYRELKSRFGSWLKRRRASIKPSDAIRSEFENPYEEVAKD